MKLNSLTFISSLIVVCLGLIFSGCDVLSGFGIGTSAQYSLVPTEGLTTDSIPQEDFFYVNLSASYYYGSENDIFDGIIYAMDEGPGTDCKISVNEDSTEDLYCLLDVMEGDLFFHEIVLEYNFPPQMCEYAGFIVPYHLNQPTIKGPDLVSQCKFLDETNPQEITTEEKYCNGRCVTSDSVCLKSGDRVEGEATCDSKSECESPGCQGVAGTWSSGPDACENGEGDNVITNPNCNSQTKCVDPAYNCGGAEGAGAGEWHDTYNCKDGNSYEAISEICSDYDKTSKGLGYCCFGAYDVYVNQNNKSTESDLWSNPESGGFKGCIGGPGRFSWDSYNKTGVPITVIKNTKKNGLKDEYTLDAITNVYDGHYYGSDQPPPSFITANHWKDVDDKDFMSSESRLSVYFPPNPSSGEVNFSKDDKEGNPYFVWTCFDSAKEVRHRIILLIREWNTQKEYNRFKESLGSSGDPDIVGAEGSLCDYYTSEEAGTSENPGVFINDSYCNDYLDLDDWEEGQSDDINSSDFSTRYPEVRYKGSGASASD